MDNRAFCILIGLGFTTTISATAPKAAYATENSHLFELTLEELLAIPVTTASRNPQTTTDAPSSITVFTRDEIERMGLTTLAQLLNMVPGVQAMFEPQEGRTNLLLGRGTPEPYGQSFLLLLDGQRMNEHYTGGFTLANRFVPLGNVERVEVIRGPGSALYGGNAFNGVINIITARQLNNVVVELGQFSAQRIGLNTSVDVERWHAHAFVQTAQDEGDHYQNAFDRFGLQTDTRDPRSALDFYGTLEYGAPDVGYGFLSLRHSEHQLDDYYEFGRLSDGINQDFNSQQFWRMGYRFAETGAWQGRLSYSRDRVRWEPFARLALQGDAPFTQADWLQGPRLDYRGQNANADGAYRWNERHITNVGVDWEHAEIPEASALSNYDVITFDYFGELRELNTPLYRFVEDRQRVLTGVYVQDQMHWSDTFSTTLGLRHDSYNDVGSSTNPRASFVYKPAAAHTVKLMLGSAFRAPGLGDLYDRDAGQTVGNPRLAPIEAKTIEIAYHYRSDKWFSSVTLFESRTTNLLATVPLPNGSSAVDSVGNNDSQGAELELSYAPQPNWLLKFNFTHNYYNHTTDIPDPSATIAEDFAPKNYGSFVINYNRGQWNLNLNGFWRAQTPILNDDGTQHLNLALSYDLYQAGMLQFKIWNVADDNYSIAARGNALGRDGDGNLVREVPLRGRQALLSYSLRY